MPGKRVQFDDDTWQAIDAVMRQSGRSFQNSPMRPSLLCSRSTSSPWDLKAALEESIGRRGKPQRVEALGSIKGEQDNKNPGPARGFCSMSAGTASRSSSGN
jgi:hypothetical protein